MLKRKIYNTLLEWKKTHGKECLLVKGARQIGKTFIIDQFGRNEYSSYLYLNFILNPEHAEIFSGSLEASEIFKAISVRFSNFRLRAGDTLLFLDEIQSCPRARTALKSLAIDGRADVIASGSLLGINFLDNDATRAEDRREESIPVGYERQLLMHSLDFEEYLWANGYDENAIGILREAFTNATPVPNAGNSTMSGLFREYLVNGGMPEVVSQFVATGNFAVAYEVQRKIVNSNLDDIARYAATHEKPKVRACYLSLPAQLARENRKFKFSAVEKGGSARKFGNSVEWLSESSLALPCHNLIEAEMPLRVYASIDTYKMYVSDVGLLCAMMGFEVKKTILDNTIKGFAKGGLYENAIMALLVRKGYEPYYFMPKSNLAEVDFLIERDGAIVPIEVKAGNEASRSFDRMLARDDIHIGYKFINGNVGRQGKKITLPHYMVMFV